MVASVVRKDGLLNRKENTLIGWMCAAIIVVMNMAFHFKDYGSSQSYIATGSNYHCWLDYQTGRTKSNSMVHMYNATGLLYGQMLPLLFLTLTTLVIIEASGAATDRVMFPHLKGESADQVLFISYSFIIKLTIFSQVTSAKFSQRTLLVIAPMTLVAYILGSLAEYEQNIGLYGSFTTLSGVLGWVRGQASTASTHHIFPCRLLPLATSLAMSQSGTLLVRSRGGCAEKEKE